MISEYTCACKERFYYDPEKKVCNRCSKGCMECRVDECVMCDKGYYLSNGICGKCHYLCEECISSGINGCLSCIQENGVIKAKAGCKCNTTDGYFLDEYRCVKLCNIFTDGDKNVTLCNKICEEGCEICRFPVDKNCTKCFEGYELKKHKCVREKEYGYFPWITSITAILFFFGKKIVSKVGMFIIRLLYSTVKKNISSSDIFVANKLKKHPKPSSSKNIKVEKIKPKHHMV